MDKQKCRILLAEDDEDDRQFFNEAINALEIDIDFQTVNNGAALLEYLKKSQQNLPHLVFLDLNMPFKSGIDCLKEIRLNPHYSDLNIAIYSTSGSELDIESTFIGGANMYIKKPHDLATLKKVLGEILQINWQQQAGSPNKESFLFTT